MGNAIRMSNSLDLDQARHYQQLAKVANSGESLKTANAVFGEYYPSVIRTVLIENVRPGAEVIKLFSCSTQVSTKFQLLIKTKIPTNKEVMLINVKTPTIVGIFTFMSRINFVLS